MTTTVELTPVPTDEAARLYELGSLHVMAAVREFGLPRTAFYDAMKAGRLPFAVLGGKRYIGRRAIAQWLAKATVAAVQKEHAGA